MKKSSNLESKSLSNKISSTSLLEICTLHCLKKANAPVYGTQILTYIAENLGSSWGPSHSNLYGLLGRLEATNMIRRVFSDNKRIYYMITPLGVKVLDEKLRKSYEALLSSKQFFDNVILTFYGNEVML